MREGK